jgi:hypothetical protein
MLISLLYLSLLSFCSSLNFACTYVEDPGIRPFPHQCQISVFQPSPPPASADRAKLPLPHAKPTSHNRALPHVAHMSCQVSLVHLLPPAAAPTQAQMLVPLSLPSPHSARENRWVVLWWSTLRPRSFVTDWNRVGNYFRPGLSEPSGFIWSGCFRSRPQEMGNKSRSWSIENKLDSNQTKSIHSESNLKRTTILLLAGFKTGWGRSVRNRPRSV